MGDYVHLFADETERTQYERSAQYNEPYISATDDTFDAEYNKRQDKQYAVKYTDLENNMHDFTFVEYDAEIEYLESTGTQYIQLDCNVTKNNKLTVGGVIIPIYTSTKPDYGIFGAKPYDQFTSGFYSKNDTSNFITYTSIIGGLGAAGGVGGGWGGVVGTEVSFELSTTEKVYNGVHTSISRPLNKDITEFRIFGGYQNTNNKYPIRIKSFYIKKENDILYDLIPVRVGNVGYMYDKVSCKLLGNSGSGNFILGPDKYDAQIEYLQSTDKQCIDTGLIPNQNTSIEIQYMDVRSSISNYFLYGARPGNANDREFSCMPYNNGKTDFRFGNKNVGVAYKYALNTKYKIISVKNKFTLYNSSNSVIHTNTATNNTFSSSCNLFLFGTNYNGTPGPTGGLRIYMFKFTDNSTLVRDMIPVRVGNVGYMYDRVSGQLFGNAGTGQFVLGPDV